MQWTSVEIKIENDSHESKSSHAHADSRTHIHLLNWQTDKTLFRCSNSSNENKVHWKRCGVSRRYFFVSLLFYIHVGGKKPLLLTFEYVAHCVVVTRSQSVEIYLSTWTSYKPHSIFWIRIVSWNTYISIFHTQICIAYDYVLVMLCSAKFCCSLICDTFNCLIGKNMRNVWLTNAFKHLIKA